MTRPEAEQIASMVTMIRPDWLKTSLITLLGKHQNRPARDVALALIWCAYDPATDSPGRINADGPWWHISRLAGNETASLPPRYTPPAPIDTPSLERIRAIREQYRTPKESTECATSLP